MDNANRLLQSPASKAFDLTLEPRESYDAYNTGRFGFGAEQVAVVPAIKLRGRKLMMADGEIGRFTSHFSVNGAIYVRVTTKSWTRAEALDTLMLMPDVPGGKVVA